MSNRPVLSALIDIAIGLLAIAAVVGTGIAFETVGYDFRAMLTVSCTVFFLAGMIRSSPDGRISVWRILRICAPFTLGMAAQMVSNGMHRLAIPAALVAGALAGSTMGVYARLRWQTDRKSGAKIAAGALAAMVAGALIVAPFLTRILAFERQTGSVARFDLALDNRTLSSADLRGRVVVLAYWASWCGPCAQEMPHLQRVYESYQNDPRVAFYAVDLAWHNETSQKGHAFLYKHHYTLPMAFDSGKAADDFKVNAVPELILIDQKGAVRLKHVGYDGSENLESSLTGHIQNLLAEK